MKHALIVLGVVAAVVLILGAFNRELVLDVDYVFGTWRSVNAFWLFALVAALVVAAGSLAAVVAQARAWRIRGKLEKELLEVYRRLRAVEVEAEQSHTAAIEAGQSRTAAVEAGQSRTIAVEEQVADTAVTAAAADELADQPTASLERPGDEPRDAEQTLASGSSAEAVTEVSPASTETIAEAPARSDESAGR